MTCIADLLKLAGADEPATGAVYPFGFAFPLTQETVPASPHYNACAPGIAGLLGQVDESLIQTAMAEKAAGVTLH